MYKFCRPRIVEENVVHIKGGRYSSQNAPNLRSVLIPSRHPLQELTVSSYVANDTLLRGGIGKIVATIGTNDEKGKLFTSAFPTVLPPGVQIEPSTIIMTGPNNSGKSVYIKQVALIVYMAHVGCFVPADAATVGLTDKILTRIATKETVTKIQSAFMIDLQQIAMAITLATSRSLLIIDEFGKGTDSNGTDFFSDDNSSAN